VTIKSQINYSFLPEKSLAMFCREYTVTRESAEVYSTALENAVASHFKGLFIFVELKAYLTEFYKRQLFSKE
jgi:hypothetical protein